MDNIKDHSLIEKYFDKELSKSALAKFKKRRETDAAFAEAFKLRQELEVAFQFEEKSKALKKTMQQVEHKLALDKKDKRIALYRSLVAAASILFLIVGTSFILHFKTTKEEIATLENEKKALSEQYHNNIISSRTTIETLNVKKEELLKNANTNSQLLDSTKQAYEKQMLAYSQLENKLLESTHTISELKASNEEHKKIIENLNTEKQVILVQHNKLKAFIDLDDLYALADTYIAEPVPLDKSSNRGRGDIDILINEAEEKYNNADYKNAITAFETIRKTNGKNDDLLFYEGMCYLSQEIKDYEKAIPIFEKLLAEEHAEEDELLWRLALLDLRTGAFKKAKANLETIAAMEGPAHNRKEEAEQLLAY